MWGFVRASNTAFAFSHALWVRISHQSRQGESGNALHPCGPRRDGAAKAAGNYAGSLFPTELSEGYDQILWTDAATHTSVEECGTMNVAFVLDGKMVVPNTSDTVLSGITRASAIALMKHAGVEVEERKVTVQEPLRRLTLAD